MLLAIKSFMQKRMFVFGIMKSQIISLFGVALSAIILLWREVITNQSGISSILGLTPEKLVIVILGVSLGILVFEFVRTIYRFRNMYYSYYFGDGSSCEDIFEPSQLSDEYKESGYQIFDIKDHYLQSDVIDQMIQANDYELRLSNNRYKVIEDVKDFIPYILGYGLSKAVTIFNDKKIRLNTDIYVEHSGPMSISKTDYFSSLATNELTTKIIRSHTRIANVFEGKSLVINEGTSIFSLLSSPCSNHIGVSTLIRTKDDKLILFKQSKHSAINTGKYVPSSSGSLDFVDYEEGMTLHQLLIKGVNREVVEECALAKSQEKLISTELLGYARLLSRGGKPEFFLYTYLNLESSEIDPTRGKDSFQEDMMLVDAHGFDRMSLVEELENSGRVTFQLNHCMNCMSRMRDRYG